MRAGISAVLFDLDGTVVDSAPDLAGTVNDMLAARGRDAVPFERLRPHAGSGARGMLGMAFGVAPGHEAYEALKVEFLDHYATRMLSQTRLFAAAGALLQALDRHGLPWGIVTNKALRFAVPLVEAMGLHRSAALVAGDSTSHTKPHPAPLLEAARRLGLPAAACVYVGDDRRDMHAGRAAGMAVLAAAWGYLGTEHAVLHWGADHVLGEPAEQS
ncbi:MAG: phosphoglycolate phosphatase, partial [Leptothrix sp. (in: Bacteria)]|nr:phosphoglycolate phosphatase [Leptothrix sp. (in: b-proteobacteria)]